MTVGGLRKRCMPPIARRDARVLILGTLPGGESLRLQQYYGHPRNHFWPVMAALTGTQMPADYGARVAVLISHGIAVWDVLASAERAGSLDSAIRDGKPNPFAKFFADHTNVAAIAFNGQGAFGLFKRHVGLASGPWAACAIHILPSTSPTHVRPLEDKIAAWRNSIGQLVDHKS